MTFHGIALLSVISLIVSMVDFLFYVLLFEGIKVYYLWIILGLLSVVLPCLAKYFRLKYGGKGKLLEIIAIIVAFFDFYFVIFASTDLPLLVGYVIPICSWFVYAKLVFCSEPVENQNKQTDEVLLNELTNQTEDENKEIMKKIIVASIVGTKQAKDANAMEQPNFEDDVAFGLEPEKPIFTTNIFQQEEYLKSLRTSDGNPIKWNRTGSYSVRGINGMVDEYEIYDISGKLITSFYINMYGASNSQSAPKGFTLDNRNTKLRLETKIVPAVVVPQIMFCRKCGTNLEVGATFCRKCGCVIAVVNLKESTACDSFMEACEYITSCIKNENPKIRRAFLFLGDEEWDKANDYFETALDEDPENALCYLGKLMVDFRFTKIEELNGCAVTGNKNYAKVLRFMDKTMKNKLALIITEKRENCDL